MNLQRSSTDQTTLKAEYQEQAKAASGARQVRHNDCGTTDFALVCQRKRGNNPWRRK